MFHKLRGKFKFPPEISVLHSLHVLAKKLLKLRGYQWEVRRNGEVKLGYWRKKLRTPHRKSAYPKRFVLIPGFGDTPLSWSVVMSLIYPILKGSYDELIIFDFPGFGGFLSHERSFPSFDLMTSVLNDTLDSLKPHTVMGHSLGGWLAAQYAGLCGAGTRPFSNRKNYSGPQILLLANPSGLYGDEATKKEWKLIFSTSMKVGFSALRPHLFAKEPNWFPWIIKEFSRFITREDVLQFMATVREDHALDTLAGQIRSKVWLLWGEDDTLIPASCATAWLRCLPADSKEHHHAILVRGAGHSIHIERPGITAAILGQILTNKISRIKGRRWWELIHSSTNE